MTNPNTATQPRIARRTLLKLEELRSSLKTQQEAFAAVVLRPNTLERNLVLADHRTEIGRLNKLIEKSTKV